MLQNKILETINKYDLFSSLDKVLIGVSGGPDSLALLYLLNDLKVKLGIRITVAHLNHGLRARSSDLDEELAGTTAKNLGLDFVSKKITWPISKSKYPNEQALRKSRYDFLFYVARKYRLNKIALAHTLDDQAETVLMRLIRGTGLYGLISIFPKRKIKSFTIVRPLIEVQRSEIESYLKKIKAKPRIDRTNLSKVFLRNRIRYGLLKELEKINPKIKEALAGFAKQAAVDYDYLCQRSKQFIKSEGSLAIRIELEKFRSLHMALQRMIVRVALEKIAGDLRTFTNKHWEEVQNLIYKRPSGSIVFLTKKIRVKKDKKNIIIYYPKTQ